MELPRNITQVGETDRNCKIYVEDYVVSYMRQMNRFAEEKEIAIALYGKRSIEQQITYCFVYGACMVQSISREVRHLSQAQNQEMEYMRKKYFPEQEFLGYQILNGEMIEGFHIYDQNICRYVKGYACFFEKNDTMLAYMLEARLEEAQPEKVEQDKYDMVKRRQEERRARFEERQSFKRNTEEVKTKEAKERETKVEEAGHKDTEKQPKFKMLPFVATAAACLAALTLLGNDTVQDKVNGKLSAWLTDSGEAVLNTEEQRKEPIIIVGQEQTQEMQAVMSTLVTEDKLADAILEENENAAESAETVEQNDTPAETSESVETSVPEENPVSAEPTNSEESTTSENISEAPLTPPPVETNAPVESQKPSEETVQRIESYVIQPGDTLIAISTSIYGSDAAVSQICALNNIANPDNIQIGQKILLP